MTEPAIEAGLPPLFTAKDRCDKCGAQAKVLALFTNGILIFCKHHGKQYEAALRQQGAYIEEEF